MTYQFRATDDGPWHDELGPPGVDTIIHAAARWAAECIATPPDLDSEEVDVFARTVSDDGTLGSVMARVRVCIRRTVTADVVEWSDL